MNTSPPAIVLFDALEVGHGVAGQQGSWTGSPSYARTWIRNGVPIPGETNPGYTFTQDDIGALVGLVILAANPNGAATANAEPVGPVVEAAPLRRKR